MFGQTTLHVVARTCLLGNTKLCEQLHLLEQLRLWEQLRVHFAATPALTEEKHLCIGFSILVLDVRCGLLVGRTVDVETVELKLHP